MNLLDGVILLVVTLQAFRWINYGFVRGVFSIGGFWIGVLGGAMLSPFILNFIPDDPVFRLLVSITTIITVALFVGAMGEYAGRKLSHITSRLHLGIADAVLGAIFGIAATLIFAWLIAAILSGTPFQQVNQQIRESVILQTLNRELPPAPSVTSQITNLINPDNFPRVFTGLEPAPIDPVEPPSSEELAAALEAAGLSTVRIESAGCGGVVNGSGFVVGEDIVATNAHVVAGIERPSVVDTQGRNEATVIAFDPELDLALLRVSGLAGGPLPLSTSTADRGTTGAVLGYPAGGPLEIVESAVLRQLQARGRDIYGQGLVTRPVYELQTQISSGNSGGPMVRSNGEVVGIIFARSEADPNVGYAIEAAALQSMLDRHRNSTAPVPTGVCTG